MKIQRATKCSYKLNGNKQNQNEEQHNIYTQFSTHTESNVNMN